MVATLRKRGKRWQVLYRSPDGTERSQSFTAKRGTRIGSRCRSSRRFSSASGSIHHGHGRRPSTACATCGCDAWSSASTGDPAAYESALKLHVKPKLGRYPLSAVKADTVVAWVAELQPLVSVRTRCAGRFSFSIGSSVAVRLGMLNSNPVPHGVEERPHARKTKPTRFLTMEQVDAFAEKIDERYRTWLLTAAYCGLRFGELAGCGSCDVDPLHGVLHVRQQVSEVAGQVTFAPPKTESGRRRIDLPRFLVPLLGAQTAGKAPDALMFPAEHGGPLRRSNFLSRVWKPAVEAAGVEASPHSLRHSYASWLAAQGVPAHELAGALGHTRPSTTMDLYRM